MAAQAEQRVQQPGDMARAWGCLIALVGLVAALVGAFLPEGSFAGGLMWLGGVALAVGFAAVVLGVVVRAVAPTRR